MPLSPKELMRHNIISFDGKPRIIKAVSELIMLEGDKNWIGASLMNGEPISEVWLERFGFQKDDDSFYRQLDLTNWAVRVYKGMTNDWHVRHGFVNQWSDLRSVTYLHQLQVLHFAMYQEHLPIPKLPKL